MTKAMNTEDLISAQTDSRVFFGQIRLGDFVRFGGHNISDTYRLQWFKVVEVNDFQMTVENKGGHPRVITRDRFSATIANWKIYLHKYSRKHNR